METFTQTIKKASESFLKSDPSSLPEILAIFLGGSRVYNQHKYTILGSESNLRDYDSIVVMPTKHDIYYLLNDQRRRQLFVKIMGIEKEECVDLRVPCPNSLLWREFDAVRFSGYDVNGAERSVKILNLADILSKETINLLSSKDRRIFEAVGPEGKRSLFVQSTSVPCQLVIQHDQWVYVTSPKELENPSAAFGYMADLLLTSACVYDQGTYGHSIKKVAAELYFAKGRTYPTLQAFSRNLHFHPTYMNWLSQELDNLYAPFEVNTSVSNAGTGDERWRLYLGNTCNTLTVFDLENVSLCVEGVSDETLRQFNDGQVTCFHENVQVSSFKSTSYTARTRDGVEIFVKETPFAKDEKNRAELAARFFPHVMNPRIGAKGELVYPLFSGATKSEVRLSYVRNGYKDEELAQRLLHAEMVQAENTLRAYRQSLSLTSCSIDSAEALPRHSIQRLFHSRLVGNSWMRLHYGKGVKLPGVEHPITFDQLLTLRWNINEQCYESLQDAFDYARDLVAAGSPYLQACPTVFGLGSGNIMLSETFTRKGGSGEILFIDFRSSGFHPVMLDLAITMFDSLFRNMPGDKFDNGTRCHVNGGEIVVDLLPGQIDVLTQAILRIKQHYLIEPLFEEVQRLGGNLEEHGSLLVAALFLCATVSRDLSNDPIAFVENVALGLSFIRARNLGDIDACFQKFGFS
ncbi:hypothetical protein F4678DRAFT_483187 [Xylaria arbuscula]|nr:hypothetical protein F4678DRAFT_483187 [Xylaria arbuscula]